VVAPESVVLLLVGYADTAFEGEPGDRLPRRIGEARLDDHVRRIVVEEREARRCRTAERRERRVDAIEIAGAGVIVDAAHGEVHRVVQQAAAQPDFLAELLMLKEPLALD